MNPQPIHVTERIIDRTVRLHRDEMITPEVSHCIEGRIVRLQIGSVICYGSFNHRCRQSNSRRYYQRVFHNASSRSGCPSPRSVGPYGTHAYAESDKSQSIEVWETKIKTELMPY